MKAEQINQRSALERIAHHYFYPPGSTMVRHPLLRFAPETFPDNFIKLSLVVAAEMRAGRFMQWCGNVQVSGTSETPEPFPEFREVLFS